MKNISFAQLEIDATARAAGVESAKIFFDGEVAVWRVDLIIGDCKYEAYAIANPRDWWAAMRRSKNIEAYFTSCREKRARLKNALKGAKKEWSRMREISRMIGVQWLDVPYLHAIQEDFNVFLRTDKLPWSVERNFTLCTPQYSLGVQMPGEFFANMLSDNYSLFTSDFFAIGVHKEERIAYVDITKFVADDLHTFLSDPEGFDANECKKASVFGSFSIRNYDPKKVVVSIKDDEIVVEEVREFPEQITVIYDSDWFQRRPPTCMPKFPHATWHALKDKVNQPAVGQPANQP